MSTQLPRVPDKYRVEVDGVGVFALQPAGNTRHATCVAVYFHPAADIRALLHPMKFRLVIEQGLSISWALDTPGKSRPGSPEVQAEHAEAALAVMGTFADRDPIGFMFQVLGQAEMELYRNKYELERLEFSVRARRQAGEDKLRQAESRVADFKTKTSERDTRLRGLVEAIHDWANRRFRAADDIRDVIRDALSSPIRAPAP